VTKRPTAECFCSKCGAEPGEACRTDGGNRTTFHRARRTFEAATPTQHRQATKLECWKVGWNVGAGGMSMAQAQELSTAYLAPEDFLDGWTRGHTTRTKAVEKARRRYMK